MVCGSVISERRHPEVNDMPISVAPAREPLRLWPGVAIVALVWLTRVAAPSAA
jgi:hypothetical protein